jgi:hypothetical protein
MSLENFFQRGSSAFPFVFWALFLFLYGGLWAVDSCFMVTFNVAKRHLQCC